jgi:hypothetical protein
MARLFLQTLADSRGQLLEGGLGDENAPGAETIKGVQGGDIGNGDIGNITAGAVKLGIDFVQDKK